MLDHRENQRRELERRVPMERRQVVTQYIRSILDARSGVDRRTDDERREDNRQVSDWMERFHQARKAA